MKNTQILSTMSIPKDEKFHENFKNLTRKELEGRLIQAIKQLEEVEKDKELAAQIGTELVKKKEELEVKLSVLEKELERKIDPKKVEELSEELSEFRKNYEAERRE